MEYIYCALSPAWQHCKMGIWRGHYADLWQRYATMLGADMTTVIVFQCTGRRALESILFGYVRKLHVCGEVYEAAALDMFLEFGNTMCEDKCNVPSEIEEKRQQEARRIVQRQERIAMERAQNRQRQAHRILQKQEMIDMERAQKTEKKLQFDESLTAFISKSCRLEGCVDANSFREAFQTAAEQFVSPQVLKAKMEARGFTYGRPYINGKRVRSYLGVAFLDV